MADAKTLFILMEAAAGYALFEVIAFEEIGGLLEDNMDTVTDLKRFGRAVKLKAFQPFESAHEALENANAISEHAMTGTLHNFLELNLPKIKKKSSKTSNFSLGLVDPGLATAVSEGLGVSCRSDDTVREILRGCRLHLETFIKGLTGGAAEKAQLGLGHSYSRSKVKFNPARSDNMIIQSIALLDQLDKDVNTFAMRVREWYSWHFPELKDIVKDNIMFARAAAFIQNKNSLFTSSKSNDDDDEAMDDAKEDKMPGLIEVVGDEDVAKAVVAAARTSMGMDCSSVDMINIVNFTERMVSLAEYRRKLSIYLTDKMEMVAPNLSALIGDTVGARLISKVCTIQGIVAYTSSIQTSRFRPRANISTRLSQFFPLGWFLDQSGKGSSFNGSDSGSRKGSLPRPQDQGKYPQIRSDLPLYLYRPGRCQEQGTDLPLPGKQVLDRHTN